MKKDIVVATLIGILIGATGALFITYLPTILQKTSVPIRPFDDNKNSNTPTVQPNQPIELTISTPADNEITEDNKITLSGKTKPGNSLIIESELDNLSKEASNDGTFKEDLNLTEGVNQIFITVYDEAGFYVTQNLNVFYTKEKL